MPKSVKYLKRRYDELSKLYEQVWPDAVDKPKEDIKPEAEKIKDKLSSLNKKRGR